MTIGPIFLQAILIPVQAQKIWAKKRIIFDWMIPLRDLCFSGSFERKFLEQLTAYDLVWGFVNESWKCTSLHVHYGPLYLWRKSRNIGSKSRRSYFRIKVEILGQYIWKLSSHFDKKLWHWKKYCKIHWSTENEFFRVSSLFSFALEGGTGRICTFMAGTKFEPANID